MTKQMYRIKKHHAMSKTLCSIGGLMLGGKATRRIGKADDIILNQTFTNFNYTDKFPFTIQKKIIFSPLPKALPP